MASENPQGWDPNLPTSELWQAFHDLEPQALSIGVAKAVGYYAYHSADSEGGLTVINHALEEDTPPLAVLRTAFRVGYLATKMEHPSVPLSSDNAAILAREFDITLLAIHDCKPLQKPFKKLPDPRLLALNLEYGTALANKGEPVEEIADLCQRYLPIGHFLDVLAQSAFSRTVSKNDFGTDHSDRRWTLDDFKALPREQKIRVLALRFSHLAAAFTITRTLDNIRQPGSPLVKV